MLSRKYANVFVPACRLTEQLVAKAKSVAGTAAKTEFLYNCVVAVSASKTDGTTAMMIINIFTFYHLCQIYKV